jgi:hypothetical protein
MARLRLRLQASFWPPILAAVLRFIGPPIGWHGLVLAVTAFSSSATLSARRSSRIRVTASIREAFFQKVR